MPTSGHASACHTHNSEPLIPPHSSCACGSISTRADTAALPQRLPRSRGGSRRPQCVLTCPGRQLAHRGARPELAGFRPPPDQSCCLLHAPTLCRPVLGTDSGAPGASAAPVSAPFPPSDVPGSLPRARADRRVGSSASGAGRRLAGREQAAPGAAPGSSPGFAGALPRCAADDPAPAACGMPSCSSISRLRRMRSSRCPRPALPPVKPALADCNPLQSVISIGSWQASLEPSSSFCYSRCLGKLPPCRAAAVAPDHCSALLC